MHTNKIFPPNPEGWKGIKDHAHKGGPKTEIGRLRQTAGKIKPNTPINPDTLLAKASGYNKIEKNLEAYYRFVSFINKTPTKTLTEIKRLESVLSVLEANLPTILEKVEEGKEIRENERKNLSLMKDIIVELNKIKYGEKHVNIHADLKDIRDAMFG